MKNVAVIHILIVQGKIVKNENILKDQKASTKRVKSRSTARKKIRRAKRKSGKNIPRRVMKQVMKINGLKKN